MFLNVADMGLGLAAGFAGFVDAIVGGGGLILLPALFATFPQAAPATLLGTNKAGAIWGTGAAFLSYVRRVRIPWKTVIPTALASLTGSLIGADMLWHLALFLAMCNMLGSLMGTRMAMTHGTTFVRRLFIVVVLLLIARTAWEAFGGE